MVGFCEEEMVGLLVLARLGESGGEHGGSDTPEVGFGMIVQANHEAATQYPLRFGEVSEMGNLCRSVQESNP
jgi:hypothetical protein